MDATEWKAPKKRAPGGGRKKLPPDEKKQMISLTLSPWLLDWMSKQPLNRSQLIEAALVAQYKIKHD